MDKDLKKNLLMQLVKNIEGENIRIALSKEIAKIDQILKNETQYNLFEEQLGFLGVIAFRFPNETIRILRDFLNRLKRLKITYPNFNATFENSLRKFYDRNFFVKEVLQILNSIRYHDVAIILNIFLTYYHEQDKKIKNQVKNYLIDFAKYNIDVVSKVDLNPQEEIVKALGKFDDRKLQKNAYAIIILCEGLLSTEMEATTWDYNSVQIRKALIQVTPQIKVIRRKVFGFLSKIYELDFSIEIEKFIIQAMMSSISTSPQLIIEDQEFISLLSNDAERILTFFKKINQTAKLLILLLIEHNINWIEQYARVENIEKNILEVRDLLNTNEEYQLFKVFIGFENFIQRSDLPYAVQLEQQKLEREKQIKNYVESINTRNYIEWKERIEKYANIETNDPAMFIYFINFLNYFSKTSPVLALKLLDESAEKLERFFPAILGGIWQTPSKENLKKLINKWVNSGQYLLPLAQFFERNNELEEKLLILILEKTKKSHNLEALISVMGAIVHNYDEARKPLIKKLFIPALKELTNKKNSNWVYNLWHYPELKRFFADFNEIESNLVLENLVLINLITFHVEAILVAIAEEYPEAVIRFFIKRMTYSKNKSDDTRYEDIPFEFFDLKKPLSKIPEKAIELIANEYVNDYEMFMYKEARLIKNIFPNFDSLLLENKLIELVRSQERTNIEIVIAILRNYKGETFIHNVCKELIKTLSKEDRLLQEVKIILQNTGVVTGELGFAKAYEQKKEEMQDWLENKDSNIRDFAQDFIMSLEKGIEREIKNAKEQIELRKNLYGSRDEEKD